MVDIIIFMMGFIVFVIGAFGCISTVYRSRWAVVNLWMGLILMFITGLYIFAHVVEHVEPEVHQVSCHGQHDHEDHEDLCDHGHHTHEH